VITVVLWAPAITNPKLIFSKMQDLAFLTHDSSRIIIFA